MDEVGLVVDSTELEPRLDVDDVVRLEVVKLELEAEELLIVPMDVLLTIWIQMFAKGPTPS